MTGLLEHLTQNPTTLEVRFCQVPADDNKDLLRVSPGVKVDFALSQANCLDMAVKSILQNSVSRGEMDMDVAFLCEFAMDAAVALRDACGVVP